VPDHRRSFRPCFALPFPVNVAAPARRAREVAGSELVRQSEPASATQNRMFVFTAGRHLQMWGVAAASAEGELLSPPPVWQKCM